jgi:hypothetical protein
MNIIEKVYNEVEVDQDVILDYFMNLEEDESPTIDGLVDFIHSDYYVSDLIVQTDVEYEGDESELLEAFAEYKKFIKENNND